MNKKLSLIGLLLLTTFLAQAAQGSGQQFLFHQMQLAAQLQPLLLLPQVQQPGRQLPLPLSYKEIGCVLLGSGVCTLKDTSALMGYIALVGSLLGCNKLNADALKGGLILTGTAGLTFYGLKKIDQKILEQVRAENKSKVLLYSSLCEMGVFLGLGALAYKKL